MHTIILGFLIFLLGACSIGFNRDSHDSVREIIRGAYSGELFGTQNLSFYSQDDYPAMELFLSQNSGSKLIGKVPYYDEKGEVYGEEYFLSCHDSEYCASFYLITRTSPIFAGGEKKFVKTMRIRKGASPTIRLSHLLGKIDNKYFHGQYAYNLSDNRVISLDPLDIDITNTGALFRRLSLFSKPYSRELTKLIHDRYYLSGGITDVGGVRIDNGSGVMILTGILEKNSYFENIPTRISARLKNPELPLTERGNIELCNDSFERQLYYTGTIKPHGIIEYACGQEGWSNNDGTAMYIQFAQLYGGVMFDSIMSRTSGVIWSEPPYKNPCTSLECPEDNEFVYGLGYR